MNFELELTLEEFEELKSKINKENSLKRFVKKRKSVGKKKLKTPRTNKD